MRINSTNAIQTRVLRIKRSMKEHNELIAPSSLRNRIENRRRSDRKGLILDPFYGPFKYP